MFNEARLVLTSSVFSPGRRRPLPVGGQAKAPGDSVISNKVRGELLGDKDLNITQSIETYEGVVQLSGFVDTPEAKNPTGAVAASVSVKQVRNNLVVK